MNGTSLPIRTINNNNNNEDYSFLEEEIFEQDGTYEELLAYDNQEEEYLFEHNKRLNLSKRRRHGLPPITPKSSMKDLVTNMLFDYMWGELINWSSQLIQTYAKTISDDFVSDSSCKTPQPTQTFQSDQGMNTSRTNDTKDSQISISNNINSNNVNSISNGILKPDVSQLNSLNLNANLAPSLTKANVIQLKPFDSALVANSNNNTFYHMLDKQAYTPGVLSRDNSTLYAQSKFMNNDNLVSLSFFLFSFFFFWQS